MPFKLKSDGSTLTRAVQIGFERQLHKNIEAYIDDTVVKTKDRSTLIQDLEETFANLRKIKLKLKHEKWMFGVPSGKLLGFLGSHRGIEAKPDKIKAIEQIQESKTVKDVRRLTRCVATLSRFISKSAEHALPFFKILKKARPVEWTPEADAALQDSKAYFSFVPTLVAPKPQELLLLSLAATNQVVSAALGVQREVEKAAAIASVPSEERREHTQARSDVDQDREEQGSGDIPRVAARKKVMQCPVYFVGSLLHGLDRGTLACKS